MNDDSRNVITTEDWSINNGMIPVEIEPRTDEIEVNDETVVSFVIPGTLPKARSAYCYDSVFNMAVNIYAEKKAMSAEKALIDNLRKMLTVEKRLMKGGEIEFQDDDKVTVSTLKRKYLNEEMTLSEFEGRLNDVLEDRGGKQ